jgi:hypothetical protein
VIMLRLESLTSPCYICHIEGRAFADDRDFSSPGNPLVRNDVVQRLAAGHFLGVPQCRECPKILPKTHWAVLLIVDHVS